MTSYMIAPGQGGASKVVYHLQLRTPAGWDNVSEHPHYGEASEALIAFLREFGITDDDFGGKLRVLETVTTVRVVESVRTLPYIGNLPAGDDPEADPTPPHGTPRPTTDRRLAP